MPRRRPVLEVANLSDFLGSPARKRRHRHSSRLTDESPRRPSTSISSRYRSVPRHRRHHRRKPKRRHRRSSRHHRRRSHRASTGRHRHTRYSDERLRYEASPPPFDRDGLRARTYTNPYDEERANFRSPRPSGYPDDINPVERIVDPRLEHTFSPTGVPERQYEDEDADSDEGSEFEQVVYGATPQRGSQRHERASRHHRHHRHRKHRRGKRRRQRRKDQGKEKPSHNPNQGDNDGQDNGTGTHGSDSNTGQYDEDGNPIQPSDRKGKSSIWSKLLGKKSQEDSQEDEKPKKGKKRRFAKIAAVALGVLVAGFAAKKIMARRRKKKADAEAEVADAHEEAESEAAGPYGGSGGQLFMGSNPLQLKVPKTSFSVKVPESEAFIVERGGKYNRRLNPGSNTLVPFIDRIAFRFSLKEVSMAVPPQQCYTRENISVIASALMFAKVEDAVAAAYGVDDARRSLMLVAQISMRKEIARLGLEEMLLNRDGLGDRILANINRASRPWGVRCTRFELRDFDIPEEIRAAFARQAQIERQVRADVLASQGANEAMKNRADGELHAQMRMSQARGVNVVNTATAEAQAISERGQAIAGALRDVAEVANEPGGKKAMHMRIAEQYIHAYMKATEGRTDLPPIPTAADVADALDKGLGLLDVLSEPGANPVANANLPPASPALEHESSSGHRIAAMPPSATNMSGSTHSRPSHQMTPTDLSNAHGTPQGHFVGASPLVGGTHAPPQSTSDFSQGTVPGGNEASNNSESTQRVRSQASAQPTPYGQYGVPVYPQAQ